jgi:hypothetical protein
MTQNLAIFSLVKEYLCRCIQATLLFCLRKCGRFHEPQPEPKQRDEPETCSRTVGHSVGIAAVCIQRQVNVRLCSTINLDAP